MEDYKGVVDTGTAVTVPAVVREPVEEIGLQERMKWCLSRRHDSRGDGGTWLSW